LLSSKILVCCEVPVPFFNTLLDTAHQQQNQEDDQDYANQAATSGEEIVAPAIAIATAEQDDE
jgi:hypothetical protein